MKRSVQLFFLLLVNLPLLTAQHTFSIVAVDTATGEVGSAGASCIDGSQVAGGVSIISGIVPGKGAVNAQATVCIPNTNLNNAINWMTDGNSPQQILNLLLANDACIFGDTSTRQYGIVDIDSMGQARSVAFTGQGAMNYKNHIVGYNYAIQGNILLGQQILDSMEAGFLSAEGSLAHQLMGALQGANVAGADSRCLAEGVSSLSSFLRVATPTDTNGLFSVNLQVDQTPFGIEPIDSLQSLFDIVVGPPDTVDISDTTTGIQDFPFDDNPVVNIFPNPVASVSSVSIIPYVNTGIPSVNTKHPFVFVLYDLNGNEIKRWNKTSKPFLIQSRDFHPGIYLYHLLLDDQILQTGRLTIL